MIKKLRKAKQEAPPNKKLGLIKKLRKPRSRPSSLIKAHFRDVHAVGGLELVSWPFGVSLHSLLAIPTVRC